ncbi:MAG: amino acid-binding protein [Lachnospiraceae bacterium]|nr:amino acid-binding protein [Lachnospiraceae bacterium]MBQ1736556.1 amino acid-binding protein [Lachnospiraceae bacterium]
MFIKQLSVFIENKEGRLDEVLNNLSEGGVNLLSASLADTTDYGVLRLIAAEPDKAKDILKTAGFTARIDEVIAVVVPDAVGSLAKVISMLHKGGINISYIYGLSINGDGAPIAIKTDNNEKAASILEAANVKTLGADEIG